MRSTPDGAFRFEEGRLICDTVDVESMAREVGAPLLAYSGSGVRYGYQELAGRYLRSNAMVCYDVRFAPTLALIELWNREGGSVVVRDDTELRRVLHVGVDPTRVVYAMTGVCDADLTSGLDADVGLFVAATRADPDRLDRLAARAGRRPSVLLSISLDGRAPREPFTFSRPDVTDFTATPDRFDQVDVRGFHVELCDDDLTALRNADVQGAMVAWVEQVRAASAAPTLFDTLSIRLRTDVTDAAPLLDALDPWLQSGLSTPSDRLVIDAGNGPIGAATLSIAEVGSVSGSGDRRVVLVDGDVHPNERLEPVLMPMSEAPQFWCDVATQVDGSSRHRTGMREMMAVARGDLVFSRNAGHRRDGAGSRYAEVLIDQDRWRVVKGRATFTDAIRGESFSYADASVDRIPTSPGKQHDIPVTDH